MERWRRLVRALRSLAGRGPVHDDLDAEVVGYLEMLADEKMAAGVPSDEAFRQARLELGGVEQVKERVRDVRPAAWLDTLARDLRMGVAQLVRAPIFSLTVIAVLALGIGANVAVFGLVNLLMLKPRAGVGAPHELVALHVHAPARADSYRRFGYADYDALRRQTNVFQDVAGHRNIRAILTDGETSRTAQVGEVTSSFFSTLQTRLAIGRSFTEDEVRPGSGAGVAVIGHAAWQAQGGQASILGRVVTLNSRPFTIVGVAPDGFTGTLAAFGPEIWVPLGADALLRQPTDSEPSPDPATLWAAHNLSVVARPRRGLTMDALNAELRVVSPRVVAPRDPAAGDEVLSANPLARTQDSDVPEDDDGLYLPLGALVGMAATLLAVASLNAANMQLARGTTRRKEIATRLALGAGRARIVAQLLVENLVLAVLAGLAGLLIGDWTLKLAGASFAPLVDDVLEIPPAPDVRVLAATLVFCLLSALVCALGPALRLSKVNVLDDLKGQAAAGASWRTVRIGPRNLVVAWQVALSLALLATAGLFVRAAIVAGQADPGYRVDQQILVRVDAPGLTARESRAAFAALLDRIRAVPGVEAAAAASLVAMGNNYVSRPVAAAGASGTPAVEGVTAQDYAVGSDYFAALGLTRLRGREFTTAEEREPSATPIAIVDEPLARALFPGQQAVGQYIALPPIGAGRSAEVLQVVGVVAGQRSRLTDRAPVAHVYRPLGSRDGRPLSIHVRLAGAAWANRANLLGGLRTVVGDTDTRLALLSASSLRDALDRTPTSWLIRAAGTTFGALGLVGLAMAVVGLYGLKAYLVARRTREIGIRMALGATPRGVVALVLNDGVRMLAAGLAVGFVLAVGAGLLVSRLVIGVSPLDPLVFAGATTALLASVGAASYLPARRAARIDPALAFRTE
jgi:predicted permease